MAARRPSGRIRPIAVPVRRESRNCFGVAWYLTEEEATLAGAASAARGDAVNGGWFHGMPCDRSSEFDYETRAEIVTPDGRTVPAGTKLFAARER